MAETWEQRIADTLDRMAAAEVARHYDALRLVYGSGAAMISVGKNGEISVRAIPEDELKR